MTDDEIFKRWDGWLEKIHKDAQNLLVLRYVFWEVQEIIKANPRIQKPVSDRLSDRRETRAWKRGPASLFPGLRRSSSQLILQLDVAV